VKLAEVRRIAMSLPEVTEQPHFEYTSFRIRGKIFATAPPGGEHLHVFVADDTREQALARNPEFLDKLLWGGKVRGLRVALREAKSKVIARLLVQAWSRKAPKALLARTQATSSAASPLFQQRG
jgi:hypothetical protein